MVNLAARLEDTRHRAYERAAPNSGVVRRIPGAEIVGRKAFEPLCPVPLEAAEVISNRMKAVAASHRLNGARSNVQWHVNTLTLQPFGREHVVAVFPRRRFPVVVASAPWWWLQRHCG